MTPEQSAQGPREKRRLSPGDVRVVDFPRGTMLRPGYNDVEVDRFLDRVAEELAALHAEKAELRDELNVLREQVAGAAAVEPPSEQAVRILATAQQTADSYVAEAEDFSRQMTADARSQYEEALRRARESAGEIIQAAQEAASRMVSAGGGGQPASAEPGERATTQDLEDQVAYLKAFAQACRVQLRAYLEALLADVETEWGRADPASLQQMPPRGPVPRSDTPALSRNVARDVPLDDSTSEQRQVGGAEGSGVVSRRT
ncbi:DivIVA domain-containing protein [Geodermatophilus sp. SYSU D00703]